MKRHRIYQAVCRICHKKFETHSQQALYCSAQCKRVADSIRAKINYRKKHPIPTDSGRSLDNNKAVQSIANEASRLGMSYGQYVAKMEELNDLY